MGLFSGINKKIEKMKYGELAEEGYLENCDSDNKDEKLDILFGDTHYTHTKQQKLAYAENCCDQMLICQRRMEEAKQEYRQVSHYLEDISAIENLEGDKKKDLLREAKSIVSLTEDKKSYKNSAAAMSGGKYEYISLHEAEMPDILKNLKDSEETLAAIKTDMNNVEGEKSALKYERKSSLQRMASMRKLLKLVLVFTIALFLIFAYGQYKGNEDYTLHFYAVIIASMGAIAVILAVNKKQEKNLRIAELKLNKIIGISNKCRLMYVNMKSTVDYMCEAYGVANSYELGSLWQNYLTVKKDREAYFKMSDNLYKATENYMDIIQSLKLYDSSVWSYQAAALVDEGEMQAVKDTLHNRRDKLKHTIDYNNELINRSKERIKSIIEADSGLEAEIIEMVDKKEREIMGQEQ